MCKGNKISGVYFLLDKSKSNDDNIIVKIGCSSNISTRIKQIEQSFNFTGQDVNLELLTYIECNNYKLMEKHLHTMLKCWRLQNGEWFKLPVYKLKQRIDMLDIEKYN